VPVDVLRDRVLFETAYVCGARASEVCGMYVEDLDLRPDDEHARVHGKGGTVRTVLLDDRGYVALLKLYLARSGYTSGPLFRAGAARCPTTPRTTDGRNTVPPPVPGSAFTSSATRTPPS
jgi:integrase/recombinase XerC/integrase/recombinase XerD